VDWKECGRKWLWCDLRYFTIISFNDLRRLMRSQPLGRDIILVSLDAKQECDCLDCSIFERPFLSWINSEFKKFPSLL
jgi:hypothetical protein